jgi:WD40 repeat protein
MRPIKQRALRAIISKPRNPMLPYQADPPPRRPPPTPAHSPPSPPKAATPRGRDKTVRLWDPAAERCAAALAGHASNVRCLAAAAGVAASGGEAAARVWDAATGAQMATLEGHSHYVAALALRRDLRLVTGSWDRTLRLWSLPPAGGAGDAPATLAAAAVLSGHTASVLSLGVQGDRAISGSLSGEVRRPGPARLPAPGRARA